jgi:putative flippase GtrA
MIYIIFTVSNVDEQMLKKRIISFIDFFYPPFRKFMPEQTFRYAACGGGNTVLGFLIFTSIFHFVVNRKVVDFGFYTFEPYSVALFISFCASFLVGFILNKYVVFTTSNLRGKVQLARYFFFFVFNLFVNYILLKIFVKYLHINAILAQMISTCIIVTMSYFTQKHFTFKVQQIHEPRDAGKPGR